MVTSKSNIINKASVVEQCCQCLCNWKNNFDYHYLSVKIQLSRIDTEVAAVNLVLRSSKSTIPIYLHQDYNYHQYGKCTLGISIF